MDTEFNLSEKRHRNSYTDDPDLDWLYDEKDIKEFIRLLKEDLPEGDILDWEVKNKIDKLAGEKLR